MGEEVGIEIAGNSEKKNIDGGEYLEEGSVAH